MIRLVFMLSFCLLHQVLFGQSFESTAITREILQRLHKEVEKDTEGFEKSITNGNHSKISIVFSVDTFGIEDLAAKRSQLDNSTADMQVTIDQMIHGYDQLLNQYYQKLLDLLKPEDKDVLVKAQRAWLAFRANEFKLISTLKKAEYSGGGTIQRILAKDDELGFIKDRVIVLFNYYSNVLCH